MNWFQSLNSKRTQIFLGVIATPVFEIFQAIVARQPIPLHAVYVILGAGGFWQVSDSIRPTVKPANVADFAEIQRILVDLQANLKQPDEVAK